MYIQPIHTKIFRKPCQPRQFCSTNEHLGIKILKRKRPAITIRVYFSHLYITEGAQMAGTFNLVLLVLATRPALPSQTERDYSFAALTYSLLKLYETALRMKFRHLPVKQSMRYYAKLVK